MRKLCTLFICLAVICTLSLPALGAETVSMTVEASQWELERGEEVTLDFYLRTSIPGCSSGVYGFVYDSRVFEYLEGTCHAAAALSGVDEQNGLLTGFFQIDSRLDSVSEISLTPGVLYTLRFRVKEDAPIGKTQVTGEDCMFKTSAAELEVEPGSLELSILCIHEYGSWSPLDEATQHRVCIHCGDIQKSPLDRPGSEQEQTTAPGETLTVPAETVPTAPAEAVPEHTLTKVQLSTPSGSLAYYICSQCGKMFEDSQGTLELDPQALTQSQPAESTAATEAAASVTEVSSAPAPTQGENGYVYDSQSHWQPDGEGENARPEAHQWKPVQITGTSDGETASTLYTCGCGAVKAPDGSGSPSRNGIIWVVIAAVGALALFAGALLVSVGRKRSDKKKKED